MLKHGKTKLQSPHTRLLCLTWTQSKPKAFNRGQALGGKKRNRPPATHRVTHTARQSMTVRLLPRFMKVAALSANPDEKENEWRRKLKKITWSPFQNTW